MEQNKKEVIKMLYIDDMIDNYVSKYLSSHQGNEGLKEKVKYDYSELLFKREYSYEDLIEKEEVKQADILFLDSMLFENGNVGKNKISGEELKLIIKKFFPFKEIIVITQFQEKMEYCTLKKFNSKTYKCGSESFFKDNWESEIVKVSNNVILTRNILKNINSKKNVKKYLIEKIENSINGMPSYDSLTKEDIDSLINAFKEMSELYEK